MDRALLGDVGPRIIITQIGGRRGPIEAGVAGDVRLEPGRRALLITEKRGDHRYVVGLTLGAYFFDPADGRWVQRITTPLARPGGSVVAPPGARRVSLERVESAVRARRP